MRFRVLVALASGLVATTATGQCTDAVAEWHFDADSILDTSAFGNSGTNFGGTFGPARNDDGYLLSPGQYAEVPNAASLNPTTGLTLLGWYKGVDFVGSGNDPIIDKGFYSHTAPYYQYHLGVAGTQYPHDPGSFGFDIAVGDGYAGVGTSGGAWVAGQWYFLAGTYDGSVMRFYLNGQLVQELAVTQGISTFNTPVRIGRFDNLDYTLPGTVDELRIFSRGLSADEVQLWFEHPDGQPLALPESTQPCAGGEVTLRAVGPNPNSQYHWRFEGSPLEDSGGHYAGTHTAQLTISGIMLADAGNYTCIVTGPCGPVESSPSMLAVCGADFNCDGFVDFFDFNDFVTCFEGGECPSGKSADFNSDGFPDFFDFNDFIDAFEAGC